MSAVKLTSKPSSFLQSLRPDKFFSRPPIKRAVRHLIIPALLGFLAGLTGAAVIFGYSGSVALGPSSVDWTSSGIPVEGVTAGAGSRSSDTLDHLAEAVVGVYKTGVEKIDSVPPGNFLASGLALTSDGWIVTIKGASWPLAQIGAVIDRHFYPAKQVIADDFNGLLFLKIETSGLSLVPFGRLDDLRSGDSLLGLSHDQQVYLTSLQKAKVYPASAQLHSSEELDYFLQVTDLPVGTPLFDQKNNFVGLVKNNGLAVPAEVVSHSLKNIIKAGKASQTYLGVNYLNLSQNIFVDVPRTGALLKNGKDRPAVLKNSPAAKAGLKEGDIVKTVDNFELNKNYSLSEAVANYEPGTKVVLTIERDGAEKKVDVTLGER